VTKSSWQQWRKIWVKKQKVREEKAIFPFKEIVSPKSFEKKSFGPIKPFSPSMDNQENNDSSKDMHINDIDEGMKNHIPSNLHLIDESRNFPSPELNREGFLGSSSTLASLSVLG
jgi:hypothetical protein